MLSRLRNFPHLTVWMTHKSPPLCLKTHRFVVTKLTSSLSHKTNPFAVTQLIASLSHNTPPRCHTTHHCVHTILQNMGRAYTTIDKSSLRYYNFTQHAYLIAQSPMRKHSFTWLVGQLLHKKPARLHNFAKHTVALSYNMPTRVHIEIDCKLHVNFV